MFNHILDRIRLPFRKDKELYSSLYHIIGVYPRNISYYKLALMHKSVMHRNKKGKPVNNERLEFLGDAILDAAVGDIVYRHFPGKREGFLTNTRSKLVQRDTLNKLAMEMGINNLILSSGRSATHNSYLGGNAFEALVGALYLDRGYDACMTFLKKRILSQMINIDKVAYKEVNFKSKLIEWSQKNKVNLDFSQTTQSKDANGNPTFCCLIKLEGLDGCMGKGFSKKESQQKAAKDTLNRSSSTVSSPPRPAAPRWKRNQFWMCPAPVRLKLLSRRQLLPATWGPSTRLLSVSMCFLKTTVLSKNPPTR